jgi:hypothetical protein
MRWWWSRHRQARYAINEAFVATFSSSLAFVVGKFTPPISARAYNRLSPEQQRFFIKVKR